MSTLLMKQNKMVDKIQCATDVLSSLIWEEGYENFRIIQTGNVTGTNVVEVLGLGLEIEKNEYVMITDTEDKLINHDTMISMFLVKSLKDVTIGNKVVRMKFNSGEEITIEVIR